MACLFMDGFDKYGPVNSANMGPVLMLGEWLATVGTTNIVNGLSSVGYAITLNGSANISRTFLVSIARCIGGVRFVVPGSGSFQITLMDGGSSQVSITWNPTGTFSVRTGPPTGTILGTSTIAGVAGTIHYLEWDITIGASANYQIWLDGISILSGTGDTNITTNNYTTGIAFSTVSGPGCTLDDFYCFDTSGTSNNAVLLTSPRVETTFPVSDNSIQFAVGASVLGSPVVRGSVGSNAGLSGNQLYLRPVTCSRAMTLRTLYFMPSATASSVSTRMVVYADNAGVPGALLGQTNVLTGITSGAALVGAVVAPPSLTAGVQYWLGIMSDATLGTTTQQDALVMGRYATVTFVSGPPSTAPAMPTAAATYPFWGAVTLTSPVNFYEVNQQPAAGVYSYVYDSVMGHEDLYNFSALSVIPTSIYAVSVKTWAAKSDTGSRTMSMRMLSGGTDSGGTNTGIGLGTTFQWYSTMFENDPATSVAWTGTGLNAAQSGFRIDS